MAAEHVRQPEDDEVPDEFDDLEAAPESGADEPVTATELFKTAFVDDEDPRFPPWLPLPGVAGAAGWAFYVTVAQGGDFVGTLFWPGVAIFALTTVVTWFGWQLEID